MVGSSTEGPHNWIAVKPAAKNRKTNLELITASGNMYSFLLTEDLGPADLKVFVTLRDDTMVHTLEAAPKLVPIDQVSAYRTAADEANRRADEAGKRAENAEKEKRDAIDKAVQKSQADTESAIAKDRVALPGTLKFTYHFKHDAKPFNVVAIYHDDKFTYIKASPEETPVVYELKDGKPNLINFQFSNGLYVVPKILSNGYLAVGKEKLAFSREE